MTVKNRFEFEQLFKSAEFADFAFVVKDEENWVRIPAHKIILSARSAYFKRMFAAESDHFDSIEICDASVEALEEFLQLFYLNNITFTPDHVAQVHALIHRFEATSLWPIVESFIRKTITLKNTYQYYELALELNFSESVQQFLWAIIRKYAYGVISNGHETGTNLLTTILKSDHLWTNNEFELFVGLRSFARNTLKKQQRDENRDNLKEVMSKYLHLIRFPRMGSIDVNMINQEYEFFSSAQYDDIQDYWQGKKVEKMAGGFSTIPRGIYAIQFHKTEEAHVRGHTSMLKLKCPNGPVPKGSIKFLIANQQNIPVCDRIQLTRATITITDRRGIATQCFPIRRQLPWLTFEWNDVVDFRKVSIIVRLDREIPLTYDGVAEAANNFLPADLTIQAKTASFIAEITLERVD